MDNILTATAPPSLPPSHPQGEYKPDVDNIVTAASCTTNCLAPVVKVKGWGAGGQGEEGPAVE